MTDDELSAEAEARVGRVLNDKYTLERLLGTGGMAAVYLGRHRNGARVAVKILHSALARNPAVRERFLREAYAANKVEHHGVAQVLDDDEVRGGEDDGAAYLVMELLEGESLEDRATHPPPIDEQELLRVFDGVLDVLESAHTRGVVHRDLKPDNIFLMRDPEDGRVRVKVLDFGLARLAEAAGNTQFGLALGTPSYMSPEQAAGKVDEIDGRTDLFALGATGFRLLTSRRIHDADNIVVLVAKMASEPAPPIRTIAPDVSPAMAAIIDKALAFERADRYQTAAEMRDDVRALRGASVASTRAAPPAPPPKAEPTIHLSGSDLEAEPSTDAVVAEAKTELAPVAEAKTVEANKVERKDVEPKAVDPKEVEPKEAEPKPSRAESEPPAPRRRTGLWLFVMVACAGLFMLYRVRTEEDPFGFLRDMGFPIASAVAPADAASAVGEPDASVDAEQTLVDARATVSLVDTTEASAEDDASAEAGAPDDASTLADLDGSVASSADRDGSSAPPTWLPSLPTTTSATARPPAPPSTAKKPPTPPHPAPHKPPPPAHPPPHKKH